MFHRQHHRGGFFGFGPQRRWEDGGEPPLDWIFGARRTRRSRLGWPLGRRRRALPASRRPQVRRARAAQRAAAPRLRHHPRPRGSLPRFLQAKPGLGVPDTADARGPGLRDRHPAGRQEGLLDHRRGPPTSQRAGVDGRGHPLARARRLGCRLTPRAGRSDARAAAAGAGAVPARHAAAR